MFHNPVRILIALLIVALFVGHASHIYRLSLIERLESFSYDLRLKLDATDHVDDRIIIVDVDEKSLKRDGRWPWNRHKLAAIVDRLSDDYGATVIGFDMVFAEKDDSESLKIMRDYASRDANSGMIELFDRYAQEADGDAVFAESLKRNNVALGFVFRKSTSADENTGALPRPLFGRGEFRHDWIYPTKAKSFSGNLPLLNDASSTAGFFTNGSIDSDGLWRRISMLMEYNGELYASLSLAVASLYLNQRVEAGIVKPSSWLTNYPRMEWLEIGSRHVPLDAQVATYIPYRGRQGRYPYYSASDVLHGEIEDTGVFNEKIVLIGTTALGLGDQRPSPVSSLFPGVEIHANMISGILDRNFKQKPAYVLGIEVAMLLVIGAIMFFMQLRIGATRGSLLALCLLLAIAGLSILSWNYRNLVIPVASPMALVVALYMLHMGYGYFVESRARRLLGGLFGQYVPPELVAEMSHDPARYNLEGERRQLTVLFSDIRGFTKIAESVEPRELSQMLNEFLTWFTRVIHDHRGTIDKYMGDGVMAFWGAPIADDNHADSALAASMQLVNELPELQQVFRDRGWPEIRIGIGLNTGLMNVGNMGSDFRMAYTVIGDAVNIGARIEDITRYYGVAILVGEETRDQATDFTYREVDRVRLRGRDQPITIYEPLLLAREDKGAFRDELKVYQQALRYYRQQNWDLAELQFINLQRSHPETRLYETYLGRIRNFRLHPPGEKWDGTFAYEETGIGFEATADIEGSVPQRRRA